MLAGALGSPAWSGVAEATWHCSQMCPLSQTCISSYRRPTFLRYASQDEHLWEALLSCVSVVFRNMNNNVKPRTYLVITCLLFLSFSLSLSLSLTLSFLFAGAGAWLKIMKSVQQCQIFYSINSLLKLRAKMWCCKNNSWNSSTFIKAWEAQKRPGNQIISSFAKSKLHLTMLNSFIMQ